MLSSSCRASAASSTGVFPLSAPCRGPRTAAAGLVGMIWPLTSQSNRCRSAASLSLAVGVEWICVCNSI